MTSVMKLLRQSKHEDDLRSKQLCWLWDNECKPLKYTQSNIFYMMESDHVTTNDNKQSAEISEFAENRKLHW